MGASFRNTGEIEALAGCDRLTIGPALLEQLAADHGPLPRHLDPDHPGPVEQQQQLSEAEFRWLSAEDAMATEKLAEGLRNFAADQRARGPRWPRNHRARPLAGPGQGRSGKDCLRPA